MQGILYFKFYAWRYIKIFCEVLKKYDDGKVLRMENALESLFMERDFKKQYLKDKSLII